MSQKTIFPLRITPPLKAEFEALIAEKREKLALTARECNLTTEANTAIENFIQTERSRLATVEPPKRMI